MPVPVVAAAGAAEALKKIPGIGRLFVKPSHVRAAAIAPQLFNLALAGELAARIELKRLSEQAATARAKAVYRDYLSRLPAQTVQTSSGSPWAGLTAAQQNQLLATGVTVARAVTRGSTRYARGGRKVTRYDPDTGRKRRVPAGSFEDLNWPHSKTELRQANAEGRFLEPGVARGAATAARRLPGGASRAGLAAAKVVTVAAFGLAAYLGTRYVLRKFAGGAKRKQEAAVAGALALREARAEFQRQTGKPVSQREAREMFDAYAVQLAKLGYTVNAAGVPQYSRSAADRFLTSYLSEEEQ